MSLTISTDVFCDGYTNGKPCGAWIHGCTDVKVNASNARSTAALFGWTRSAIGGKVVDLCDGPHDATGGTP